MKKKMFGRLGAAAVALTLITTAMMSGTLAKYTQSYDGTVKVDAAAWNFTAKNGEKDFSKTETTSLDLGITTVNGIDGGKIAPGSAGSFKVTVNNEQSEVQAQYEIKIAPAVADNPLIGKLKFATDGTNYKTLSEIETDNKGVLSSGTLQNKGATTGEKTKEVTVSWQWPVGDGTAADGDNDLAGSNAQLNITITGTQVAPGTSAS